jgi:SAM-dependent methyltransferase
MNSDYYNELYSKNKQYFGDHPDNLLRDYFNLCDKKGRVLDIGIGQGRNARFLLQQGFGVDGIDVSDVAVNNLKSLADGEGLDLRLYKQSFEDFDCPARTYSAIMVFNVFPVLSVEQINLLARKTQRWLKRGGIIFLTGFTPQEKYFRPKSSEWHQLSADTYSDENGNFRTFIDMPDVIAKFTRLKPIYQREGYGERHTHGSEQMEQHHLFEIILRKNKFWI